MIVFASKRLQEHRKAVCNSCEYATVTDLLDIPKCSQCGCLLGPKIAIYAFKCPKGKWLDKLPKEQS
jgi:predicted RNA-binding Zn-ribbon protein involved in translation (DUF1610 family)